MTTGALAAATGFHGTASDLVRYFSEHVPGRGSLLSDHAKRLAQRKAWSALDSDPAARGYGAGFVVDRINGREVRGHSGGFPGQITQSVFDPASSLVVSVLTSSATGPAGMIATGIVHLLDAAADEHAPGPVLPADVDTDRYTGRFTTFEGSRTWHASATGCSRSTRRSPCRPSHRCGSRSSTRTRSGWHRATASAPSTS